MTGLLTLLFWLRVSNGIRWADAVLAFTVAVLGVSVIIIARRAERAAWIARPTLAVYLLAFLGVGAMYFGAMYADDYLLHSNDPAA